MYDDCTQDHSYNETTFNKQTHLSTFGSFIFWFIWRGILVYGFGILRRFLLFSLLSSFLVLLVNASPFGEQL